MHQDNNQYSHIRSTQVGSRGRTRGLELQHSFVYAGSWSLDGALEDRWQITKGRAWKILGSVPERIVASLPSDSVEYRLERKGLYILRFEIWENYMCTVVDQGQVCFEFDFMEPSENHCLECCVRGPGTTSFRTFVTRMPRQTTTTILTSNQPREGSRRIRTRLEPR